MTMLSPAQNSHFSLIMQNSYNVQATMCPLMNAQTNGACNCSRLLSSVVMTNFRDDTPKHLKRVSVQYLYQIGLWDVYEGLSYEGLLTDTGPVHCGQCHSLGRSL